MKNIETEVLRRVYVNDEDVFIEVCPCPDNEGDAVKVRSTNSRSEEWFGEIDLSLEPEIARHLANAILACAAEVSK